MGTSIRLSAGQLPPPACYEGEQDRFEAYVAAIVATLSGGVQWTFQTDTPIDVALYWLRKGSDSRPRGPRQFTVDGRWVPWLEIPVWGDTSGGVVNAYTLTTGHSLVSAAVKVTGRRVLFIAEATNTAASTLDVDGTGAVSITRHGGDPLLAGDLVDGFIYEVIYNAAGPRWELATPVPPTDVVLPVLVTINGSVPATGSSQTFAHGKTVEPDFTEVVLVCDSADRSYVAGDLVKAESFFWTFSNYAQPLFSICIDDSEVTLSRGSNVDALVYVAPKGGAGSTTATAVDLTKWSVRVKCYFIS